MGDKVSTTPSQTLLTKAIADRYTSAVKGRLSDATVLAEGAKAEGSTAAATVQASLFVADYKDLMENEELAQEIFGPTTVVVGYQDRKQLLAVAEQLEGHLTATLQADESELADYADLIDILTRKVGRLILNAYPTGVEVCHAMVHGGPFPATSDGRSTSVGTQAIFRFTRLVCYQSFPDAALPDELKSTNPLGIMRLVDGDRTASPPPSVPLCGPGDDRPAIPVNSLATAAEGGLAMIFEDKNRRDFLKIGGAALAGTAVPVDCEPATPPSWAPTIASG